MTHELLAGFHRMPDTPHRADVNTYTDRDAVLVDLLGLRIEAWFREARQRAACWEPAPCPAPARPVYWQGDGA